MPTPSDIAGAPRDLAVIRDDDLVPAHLQGAIVAIGNFDGLHRGHQKLVGTAMTAGRPFGRPAAILTFEPHPRAFFAPDALHFRLTSEPAKFKILDRLGLDAAFILRFDGALAATSPRAFIAELVRDRLKAAALVVGTDFHFGKGREGTPELLAELARQNGLDVTMVETVTVDDAPVSSSRIRQALEGGDIETANHLLGYRWFVGGEVLHGEKRGRTLGYPTANLRLDPGCRLAHGIYAVRIATAPGEIRNGVASFGRRPTFDNGSPLLETYIFDFAGDLYGRAVEVEFVGRIRAEERFETAEALVARMELDERAARALLTAPGAFDARSFIG